MDSGSSPEAPQDSPPYRQVLFESSLSYADLSGAERRIDGVDNVIRIFDLSNVVPEQTINGYLSRLRRIMSARPGSLELRRRQETLPDYPPRNAGHLVQAKVSYGDYDWGSGIFYLVQFTQGRGNYPNNSELGYLFQGLSKDGRFYVSADIRVAHPMLPLDSSEFPSVDSIDDAAMQMDLSLDGQKDSSFIPSLGEVRSLISGIKLGE
ncbi:hypothetical protein [Haloferula chungangensis]